MDRTQYIFNNKIDEKTVKKANKSKQKFIKKFGNDLNKIYHMKTVENVTLNHLGVKSLTRAEEPMLFDDQAVIIGNIRMGFGHYRIAIAIASCAHALGYKPYWFDLSHFKDSTGGKMISHQNDLYAFGSRLSQKSRLFNHFIWEPMNSQTFRKLSYNAIDQKNSELLKPMFYDIPKDIPFIGTHVWPTQGAVHHGMSHVVNVIPDNWPMALHLAQESIHTVQTPFAYLGYKLLHGMDKKMLKPMLKESIVETGYYIDHELVSNIESDTKNRLERLKSKKPLRLLIPVGGAGAGFPIFKALIEFLLPYIKERKVQIIFNFGDHLNVYHKLISEVSQMKQYTYECFNQYDEIKDMSTNFDDYEKGIYAIYHKDIYEAVYSTNLLMRSTDLLVTKPSELSFYPMPKLFIKRVGGHEAYGAIHSSEMGDGTYECHSIKDMTEMLYQMISNSDVLESLNQHVLKLHEAKKYHGGYEVVKLAFKNM